MKKIIIIMCIIGLFTTGCTKKVSFGTKGEFYEMYENNDGRKVYVTLKKVTYLDENKKERNLIKDLKQNKITIDELIKKMAVYSASNDGGSVFFESNEELSKTKFYLAYCNSLPANGGIRDIFITEEKEKARKLCTIDSIEFE